MLFRNYLMMQGEHLDDEQLAEFESMLELQDQTLFDAYSGKSQLPSPSLQQLMDSMMRMHEKTGETGQ